ncbi:MAG: GntR family transcriptional regulator [Acidobacteria bacterium]|nr:GntR family transcriptional regulator [Acidobacteriota bacterium]
MIPFRFTFQPGVPINEQVVFAAKKAILSRRLKPGESFPSVRVLSRELKIHANTAQRVVGQLKQEGLIEVHTGIGTVVAEPRPMSRHDRSRLVKKDVELLVVEAIRLGMSFDELQHLVAEHWSQLGRTAEVEKP